MSALIEDIGIIDTDTHVAEPPDLWTSRVAARYTDHVPHIVWDEDGGREMWVMGDKPIGPPGIFAMAGWNDYAPDHPPRMSETDPAIWDSSARLAQMDRDGVQAQVLYSNVALFDSKSFADLKDQGLRSQCINAYNDFQTDFSSIAPDRFLPMTLVPFWDVEESLQEIRRCAALGHRGLAFSQEPAQYGLPSLVSRHWDPIWALAAELGHSVNFHVAAVADGAMMGVDTGIGRHTNYASGGSGLFMSNMKTITSLIFGGVCHRFPTVNFVSVESGIGWIPTALAMMDWQWTNSGVRTEHPEYDLLPSEYFKRQIYGTFWFERETAVFAIEQLGADNIFFESDFPHGTCLAADPKPTPALPPREYLADGVAKMLSDDVLRKVLHDNAARVYHLS